MEVFKISKSEKQENHSHQNQPNKNIKIAFFINFIFSMIEFFFGSLFNSVSPKFYVVLRKPLKIDIFAEPTKNSSSYSYILTLFTPLPQHI